MSEGFFVFILKFIKPSLQCAAHLLVKAFPVILGHQSKQRQEGPTKRVEAGVIVVWVPSHFDASVPLRTLPAAKTAVVRLREKCPAAISQSAGA